MKIILSSTANKFRALLPTQIEIMRAATPRVFAAGAPVFARAAFAKPGLHHFMTYVDALREGNRFAQKREFARSAYAEWQRFIGSMGGKLDALVERYRLNTFDWLPLAPLRFVRDRLAGVLDWALYRPLDKSERVVVRVEESMLITEEREWALATGAIHAAAELAQSAGALQRSAALQIDAAIYALDDLMAELRSVMDVGSRKTNVFAHQADCEHELAQSLFAVTAAVRDLEQSREKIQNAA